MVVIVVGIIRVDMVSIFAMWSLSRRGESRRMKVSSRDREESPRYWTTLILDAIAIADLYRYSTTLAVRFRMEGGGGLSISGACDSCETDRQDVCRGVALTINRSDEYDCN